MKFKEEKLGSYYVCAFVFKELDTYYISHTLHLYFFYATKILLRLRSNNVLKVPMYWKDKKEYQMRNKDAKLI